MKNVTYQEFVNHICKKENIKIEREFILNKPFTEQERKLFVQGNAANTTIKTNKGLFPFLVEKISKKNNRYFEINEEFENTIQLIKTGVKSLDDICKEANLVLIKIKTRICEGGGWTSAGHEYHYDGIYCEF